MRSDAREVAFQVIFARLFNEETDDRFLANTCKKYNLKDDDRAFAVTLVKTVFEHMDELAQILTDKVARFMEYRIYQADRAIMYLAIAEIKYFDDVPPVVSVSEAVALARKFSTEKSVDFVNGVLGGIINDLN